MRRYLPALALTLASACSEYELKGMDTGDSVDDNTVTDVEGEGSDTGSSSEPEDLSFDFPVGDGVIVPDDSEDTDEPDEPELPDMPFADVLEACLGLDGNDCHISLSEGGVVSDCENVGTVNAETLISEIEQAAQSATGDTSVTFSDVLNGDVEAYVRAHYGFHESGYNGEDTWLEYGSLVIGFQDQESSLNASSFSSILTPYDPLEFDTVRCAAYRRSWDIETPREDVETTPVVVENWFHSADRGNLGYLGIDDFSFGALPITKVYGVDYDRTDPDYVWSPVENALEDETKEILDLAKTLTGEVRTSVVVRF